MDSRVSKYASLRKRAYVEMVHRNWDWEVAHMGKLLHFTFRYVGWRGGYSSVVEHSTADREVPGSNPGAPSISFSFILHVFARRFRKKFI